MIYYSPIYDILLCNIWYITSWNACSMLMKAMLLKDKRHAVEGWMACSWGPGSMEKRCGCTVFSS